MHRPPIRVAVTGLADGDGLGHRDRDVASETRQPHCFALDLSRRPVDARKTHNEVGTQTPDGVVCTPWFNDGKRQLELLSASLSTMMVLFRAVLRLHGERPDGDPASVSQRVGSLTGLDAAPFVRTSRHLRGELPLAAGDAGPVLAAYLRGMEQLEKYLDGYTR